MASDLAPVSFDLLAASLRVGVGDVASFVEALAAKLEDAVPGAVQVQRVRQGFRGARLVRTIVFDAGGQHLELRRDGNSVQALRGRVSGGIVIKTEPLDIDGWIDALTVALTAEAERNEKTRLALERLLLAGGPPG